MVLDITISRCQASKLARLIQLLTDLKNTQVFITKYMETITYRELARRVGDMVLMNEIVKVDHDLFDNVENGDLYETDPETEEQYDYAKDLYQFYAITESGYNYLKYNTNEIVLYSEMLDTYFWGITHFGTPWDGVEVTLKDND